MFYGATVANGGSYSAYSFVQQANLILPLKLVNFNVVKNHDNAILNWSVENQSINNSHFEIQRSSDGILFTQIGTLPVVNNGSSANTYQYSDENISKVKSNGVIFYRLKQFDKDGQFVFSKIGSVRINSKLFNAVVYPNPAKNSTLLTYELPLSSKVNISILDAAGKEIQTFETNSDGGINQKRIDLSKLAAGSYKIVIRTANLSETLSFIKGGL
jgi:hypothetical protein